MLQVPEKGEDNMEFEDNVRAVTCVRVMGALTDLGVKYRVDEDDEDVLTASWAGYFTQMAWDGPFDPVLKVTARLWADMSAEKLPDLQRWLCDFHAGSYQPVVTYVPGEEGRLLIVIRGRLSLKGGMSDEQLRDNLDRLLRSISQAARAVACEFPELTHTEATYLRSIGAPELDVQLPVTSERMAEIVRALDIEDIDVFDEHVAFDVEDCTYLCSVEGEGSWLRVRSPMAESWSQEHFEQLMDIANDLNRDSEQATVLVERIEKWYRIVLESNTAIAGGMTTAQLGEALRDAVWGHVRLWGTCCERLRATEATPATD